MVRLSKRVFTEYCGLKVMYLQDYDDEDDETTGNDDYEDGEDDTDYDGDQDDGD